MRQVVVVFAMLLLGTAAACSNAGDRSVQMTRVQIEQELAKDLPRGATREQVVAFLATHNIENSSATAGAPPDQILAIYRNVAGGTSTVTKAVQVIFRFKGNVLEGYSITEKLTGP